jgi:hypothetical protein
MLFFILSQGGNEWSSSIFYDYHHHMYLEWLTETLELIDIGISLWTSWV